jgi:DnaK suppressor protein
VSKSKAASTGKKASSSKTRAGNRGKPKGADPAGGDGDTLVAERQSGAGRGSSKANDRAGSQTETALPEGYRPSDDESFMNEHQRLYFRTKLVAWKEDIIRQTRETLEGLTTTSEHHADLADRATSETDRALELRARDRQRKLVAKINAALARIEDGSYGYCEETGEPIGLRRLEARPIATLSLEAQERHERRERVFRED